MIDAKRKALIFLTLAFILAVVAAGFILNQIRMAQESLGETVKVAAAGSDIRSYTSLEKSDIEWVEMPRSSQVSSFIQDEKDLDEAIAVVNLNDGDILTKNVVRKKLDIPAENRVVWLNPTSNVVIDQAITEGDLVDVYSVMETKSGVTTERLLETVPVVQLEEIQSDNDDESFGPAIRVSLDLDQAEKLIHAQNAAKQIRILRVNQIAAEAEQAKKEAAAKKAAEKKKEEEAKEAKAKEAAEQKKENAKKEAAKDESDEE
ncbi:hypothetical protein [Guptibacillus algicola]|uniref:hypothetical protein n=1 Tax=Guptibacillus algicola TaxID=225844 RepID=UPI001CD1CC80|nr:hypothetical protein [Alkalihalobacillus algicola]MCA0989602.1 hypothetical protein [Alkalihalobacillus algicola]